jgi:hypothetical protein
LKCETVRQQEALAKRAVTTWDLKYRELITKWTCKEHKTEMQCWRPQEPPFHGNICMSLSAFHLDTWTTACMDGSATLFSPPAIAEFWKLKDSKKASNRSVKAMSATLEPTIPSSTVNNVTISLDNSIFDAKTAYDAEVTKQTQSQSQQPPVLKRPSSLITEYVPREWIARGLTAFLMYCARKYEDDDYLGYFISLSRDRLGIDVYKAAMFDAQKREKLEEILIDRIMIPAGTVQRWLDDFDEWYTIIKGTVPIDYGGNI